jgi:hypothetical protein
MVARKMKGMRIKQGRFAYTLTHKKEVFINSMIVFVFVAGCAYRPSVTDEARYELGKPIDCSTAQQDIQILENEKAFSSEQAKAGIKMIVPAAAARSILHRDYLNRGEVATGE